MDYNKKLDEEYLARDLIKDIRYDIDKDSIKIHSPHSVYIEVKRMVKLNQKELFDNYSKIIRFARQNKIKVHYNQKCKTVIKDVWKDYERDLREWNRKFDELLAMMPKLKERGIHIGNSDDYFLYKCVQERWKLSDYVYAGTPIAVISHISNYLKRTLNEIELHPNTIAELYL